MSSFGINLDLQLRGEDKFRRAIRTVGQLEAALKKVGKEVDIAGKLPGRGKEADRIGTVTKNLNDLAKKLVQTGSSGKKTQAGVADLTSAFKALSASSNTASLSFKNFVEATVVAEREANKLARAEENIRRSFLGMQSVEEREAQLERRANLLRNLRTRKKLKEEEARARDKNARAAEREAKAIERQAKADKRSRRNVFGDAAQGAILGGGFPLLFGGPSFSAAGGLIGGGVAGAAIGQRASFAGGIAGSVLLTPLDAAVEAAVELGKALEEPTKNAQQLIDLLPLSGTKTKGLIRELQDLGLNSTASAIAVETLGEEIGDFGVKDIQKFKEKNDEFTNEVKKLRLALAALASNKLIGFITFLTQAINLFNRGGGVNPGGGMLGRAAGFAVAQGEMADQGALGGTGASPTKPDKPPLPAQKQIDIAKRVKAIRKAEIMLAGLEVKIEQDRFNLIRGQFEVEQSKIALGRANIKLAKADLELANAQTDVDRKRLGLKQALAEAAFLEAKAAKENAEISARQQQATAELGTRQFLQGIQLNEMQQRIAVDRQTRAASAGPAAMLDPFFGKSEQLKNEQAVRYTETLRVLNEQIEENNMNIKMGKDLSDAERAALVKKDILLQRELKLLKELQPARDEAALAQVRFAEAMALTVPVTDGLFDSLYAVVEGTKTAEQAFADFLRSIASILQDAAKQIIATYIAIGVARMFAGMGGFESGNTKVGQMADMGNVGMGGAGIVENKFGQGFGTLGPNFGIRQYASGGYVSGPTNALIGEGGQPEYVIPASKMTEAMGRYARGARGAAVIPEGDGVSTEGGMGGGSGVVDVRYSVERINNVDYVTAAEFERGMNQAAKRGAELGRQGVYSDLVNKRSVRSRVGV